MSWVKRDTVVRQTVGRLGADGQTAQGIQPSASGRFKAKSWNLFVDPLALIAHLGCKDTKKKCPLQVFIQKNLYNPLDVFQQILVVFKSVAKR